MSLEERAIDVFMLFSVSIGNYTLVSNTFTDNLYFCICFSSVFMSCSLYSLKSDHGLGREGYWDPLCRDRTPGWSFHAQKSPKTQVPVWAKWQGDLLIFLIKYSAVTEGSHEIVLGSFHPKIKLIQVEMIWVTFKVQFSVLTRCTAHVLKWESKAIRSSPGFLMSLCLVIRCSTKGLDNMISLFTIERARPWNWGFTSCSLLPILQSDIIGTRCQRLYRGHFSLIFLQGKSTASIYLSTLLLTNFKGCRIKH